MKWGDKEPWAPKFDRLLGRIDELAAAGTLVGLVGASAGASAVLNAYAARQGKVIGVVCIAGKINRPEVIRQHYRDTNPAFVTSAIACQESLTALDEAARQRILSKYAWFDEVVTTKDSHLSGAHNRRSPTILHGLTIAYQLTFGARANLRFLKQKAST